MSASLSTATVSPASAVASAALSSVANVTPSVDGVVSPLSSIESNVSDGGDTNTAGVRGSSSAAIDIDGNSLPVGHDVDMEEVPDRNTTVDGAENVSELQDIAHQLATQITRLTTRVIVNPEDASLRAEYTQKTHALEMVTRNLENLKRLPRYQGYLATLPKPTTKGSDVVPRNLPLFQWSNEISNPTAPVFADVVACLVRFQDVMFSYGLDFDDHFLRLVPPYLSSSQRVWYDQFLSGYDLRVRPPTWYEFKKAMTSRYGLAVDEDRAAAAWDLVNVVMNKGESLDNFIDRFNSLRRRAVDQVPPSSIVIQQYLHALPENLREQVIVATTTGANSDKKADIDEVILLSRKLFNALDKSKNGGSSGSPAAGKRPHFDQSTSSTMKSKYASLGVASSSHGSQDVKKVQKSSGGSSRVGEKWCVIHKTKAHDITECRLLPSLGSIIPGATVSAPIIASSSSASPRASSRASFSRQKNSKKCYRCGALGWSRDHVCNTAVRSQDPSTLEAAHALRSMHISAPSGASLLDNTTTSTSDMDVDSASVLLSRAQQCKYSNFYEVLKSKGNSILIPIIVNDHRVIALVDTGATFSICTPRFLHELQIQDSVVLASPSSTIQLGHSTVAVPRIGSINLSLRYNKKVLKHTFEVFDFFSENNDIPILLGLDILPKLNIALTGLATSYDDEDSLIVPNPIDPESVINLINDDPFGSPSERKEMLKKLQPLLDANAAIDLKNTYCTLPNAVVKVDTVPGKVAFRKPYGVPLAFKDAVLEQIRVWLEDESVIEIADTNTPFNSPILCVGKKDEAGVMSMKKPRIVCDLRLLNSILISDDKFQYPPISDIFDRVGRCKIITTIDIQSCFTSFLIHPDDRHKLAFTCPFTHVQYVFRKAPFGLTFVGNHVQRVITNYLRDLEHCTQFVDDLQVATFGTLEHHTECVAEVIRRLTAVNLKVNTKKLVLAQKSIHVLGWSIVEGKLIPDPRKLSNLHKWEIPSTGRRLQKYLGFMNYFRSSIPMYARLSAPLDKLRSANSLVSLWTDEHTECFEKLKLALSSAPCLTPPDFSYRMHVATDASISGIGGILYFIKNDTIHYVAMASRALSPSERNYSTTKRELLAIVYMLTKYHKWLFNIPFTLHTDHRSLIYLKSQQIPNLLMLSWYETIFSYDFDIVHIPGVTNLIPDALSRLFSDEDDHNLEGGKLHISNYKNAFEKKKRDYKRKIISGKISKSNLAQRTVTSRFKTDLKHRSNSTFSSSENNLSTELSTTSNDNNNTVTYVNRALQYSDYMTPPPEERMQLILQTHLLGHFGINHIEQTLKNDKFYWTNMRMDIEKVVKDCTSCQQYGIYRTGFHPLKSIVPSSVFEVVCIDMAEMGKTSFQGNNYILVIVDYFSRFTILKAVPDKNSYTIARVLLEVFCLMGFPKAVHSDNGSEFVNEVMNQLLQLAGIKRILNSPYTPNNNGLCERHVGTSKQSLIRMIADNADTMENWDLYLDVVMYSMNLRYTHIHKTRPFCSMFYRQPNDLQDYVKVNKPAVQLEKMDAKQIEKNMSYVKDTVIPAMAKQMKETQLKDHTKFEKRHKIIHDMLPLNSKVMITNVDRTSKSQPRFVGPYVIKAYTQKGTYILQDLTGSLFQRDVPINQIKLIESGDRRSRNELKETHYEVEAIINHRKTDQDMFEYLTAFVGYNEPEWIIETDFDSKATIRDYWSRRNAIDRQQQGQFDLPDTINPQRKYTRKNFELQYADSASSTHSNNSKVSKRLLPKTPYRRSNRLRK